MNTQTKGSSKDWRTRIWVISKTVWPAAFVFLAFDLAVDPELSLLRGSTDSDRGSLQIVDVGRVSGVLPESALAEANSRVSEHIMFGVEAVAEEMAMHGAGSATVDGGWGGKFAGVLEGDGDSDCWSPYEVNIRVRQDGNRVYGPGSYVVDPASCSTHEGSYLSFFTATGERIDNNVSLELTNDETGEVALLFNGIVAANRIVGAFTLPNGAPVSGTTVLTLADPAQSDPES